MRTTATFLFLLGLGTLSLPAPARAMEMGSDRPAVHGMLLVGNGEGDVFLSHLPMFHSPHGYQVLLEARFDRQALYAQDHELSHEKLYTLAPRPFVLTELAQGRKSFTADVYRGHFERGGTELLASVQVQVVKVLYFRKFEAFEHHPEQGRYLFFGSGSEKFLAHRIASAPDFDEVLQVETPASPPTGEALDVTLPAVTSQTPLTEGASLQGHAAEGGASLPLEISQRLYLETGDLQ